MTKAEITKRLLGRELLQTTKKGDGDDKFIATITAVEFPKTFGVGKQPVKITYGVKVATLPKPDVEKIINGEEVRSYRLVKEPALQGKVLTSFEYEGSMYENILKDSLSSFYKDEKKISRKKFFDALKAGNFPEPALIDDEEKAHYKLLEETQAKLAEMTAKYEEAVNEMKAVTDRLMDLDKRISEVLEKNGGNSDDDIGEYFQKFKDKMGKDTPYMVAYDWALGANLTEDQKTVLAKKVTNYINEDNPEKDNTGTLKEYSEIKDEIHKATGIPRGEHKEDWLWDKIYDVWVPVKRKEHSIDEHNINVNKFKESLDKYLKSGEIENIKDFEKFRKEGVSYDLSLGAIKEIHEDYIKKLK